MEKVGQIFRKTLVRDIKEGIDGHGSTFILSYSAVTSAQMDSLRKDLKSKGARVSVSRNRIARIALKEIEHETLAEEIKGQTAFIWGSDDCAAVSKALVEFVKKNEGCSVQGGLLDGAFLRASDVQRLADLPSREVLLAQLLQVMLAPMTRLAGVLNGKSRDLLSILKQYSEQKGGK